MDEEYIGYFFQEPAFPTFWLIIFLSSYLVKFCIWNKVEILLFKKNKVVRMLRTLTRMMRLSFAGEVQKSSTSSSSAGLTFYKDGQLVTRNHLVLKKTEDIESYVIKTIQNYFRTTFKQGNPVPNHRPHKGKLPFRSWTGFPRSYINCHANRGRFRVRNFCWNFVIIPYSPSLHQLYWTSGGVQERK